MTTTILLIAYLIGIPVAFYVLARMNKEDRDDIGLPIWLAFYAVMWPLIVFIICPAVIVICGIVLALTKAAEWCWKDTPKS
jgi:uncharacterized membrane protein YhdT